MSMITASPSKENEPGSVVSQEEKEHKEIEAIVVPPRKRRRSLRNINDIKLRKHTMFYRRLNRLFFQDSVPDIVRIGPLELQCLHREPNVFILDDFLSNTDLEYLDGKIEKSAFQKSFVDKNKDQMSGIEASQRTSTFLSFQKGQDVRTVAIEQKAADLLGCSPSQIEPLQLVRYLPGQFFGMHHDMGDLNEDGTVELPCKKFFLKRRLVTIFCYLNDCEKGGSTYFEVPGIRVASKRGRMVLFPNITKDGLPDPRTIHAGEPVEAGIKYGLNIWICEE